MEDKSLESIEKAKAEAMENVRNIAMSTANEAVATKLEEVTKSIEKAATVDGVEKIRGDMEKSISDMQSKIKTMNQTRVSGGSSDKAKMFVGIIKSAIKDNEEIIKSYRGGVLPLAVKAITFDSFGEDSYEGLTTQNLAPYRNPYSPVYLRNIFPNVNAKSGNVTIWKQGATTGAAAIWQRGTGDDGEDVPKPEVTPSWYKEVVPIDWIPGITHVPREVLDDVDFVASEVSYNLVYGAAGVLAAENRMILDYIADKAVDFTLPDDVDPFENSLETILAAAFGQLGDSYMAPTHIIINNWDYLKFLGFNKAAGSGEYDYPNLSLQLINNQLFINRLQAVPNPTVTPGAAYVVAADHSRFIDRQGVQLRMSEEHADNFVKNMVTYRAESRAGFFTYNDNSLIKVTLPTPAADEAPEVPEE